jgi:hypothetical protein
MKAAQFSVGKHFSRIWIKNPVPEFDHGSGRANISGSDQILNTALLWQVTILIL